ncbi:SUMF1/EgtB/PvdO family nonheme iron enzyme [Inmirania thermothiophila]|uniref:Formylglycine-generating enzyme required for sulfatase activity n=1 Tax=Inmirania thermothiophila TaxID=1750597 RepID=A0A3N1Y719_9GAMM|nr:SUMF1/EgtB/PvdO family nonheme iron enzyme [Inmirania thermothiophila]ROR34613.1 formylglycine-generating enzyme required for sulfatase activity [Inmirania thermothiophila]
MAGESRIDERLLGELVPVNGLSAGSRRQLAEKAELLALAPGDVLFRRGERDGRTLYLLEGEIELTDGRGGRVQVRAGTATARHPLAQHQPRQVTATARTPARVLAVETALLDMLLTWDQSPDHQYEVEEIAEDDGDWMTRMLQNRVFLKLPPANIQQIIMRMEDVRVRAGDVVVRQGEEGDYYYYIRKGRAVVLRRPSPGAPEVRLAELGEGDGFGEEALVADERRNATVRMLTDGHLMRLAKKDFVQLIRDPLQNAVDYYKGESIVASGGAWLDVRLPDEHANAHIAGSINIPLPALRLQLSRLQRGRPYVIYCDTGRRSAVAAFILSEKGYEAHVLAGGLQALPPEVFLSSARPHEEGPVVKPQAAAAPRAADEAAEALRRRAEEEAGRVLAEARRAAEEEARRLLEEARRAMEEVRAEQARARAEAERLAQLKETLEGERRALEEAAAAHTAARDAALTEARAEAERLRRRHDEMEAAWVASQQEVARLEEELARLREARAQAASDMDRARREADEARRGQEEAAAALRRRADEAEAARRELEALRERLEAVEAERERLAAEAGELRSATELEEALREAEAARARAEQRAAELERSLDEQQAEVRRLAAELAAATDRIHELEVEKEELWRARKEAEQEVAQARREAVEVIQRAHQEAEALKRELKAARSEAEEEIRRRLEAETSRLQAQLRSQVRAAERRGAAAARTPGRRRVAAALAVAVTAAVAAAVAAGALWAWRAGLVRLPDAADVAAPPAPPAEEPGRAGPQPAPEPRPAARAAPAPPRSAPPAEARARPGRRFRDPLRNGGLGPEMVEIPGGRFVMGSGEDEPYLNERPAHEVRLAAFAVGRTEVTFEDYDRFAQATGRPLPDDEGWGRGRQPVINVSWEDAAAYAAWLSQETGHVYRLPSEAQWEYAARAGTGGIYWWGSFIGVGNANCFNCGNPFDGARPVAVGSFPANPFGLHDTAGNVAEWVQDCYHPSYEGAPADGRPWEEPGCAERVVRGGSFTSAAKNLRVTVRERFAPDVRAENIGFRLVRLR